MCSLWLFILKKFLCWENGVLHKMGSGPASQYKHSAIFIGDNIIIDESSLRRGKARYDVSVDGEVDTSWGESPSIKKSGRSRHLQADPECFLVGTLQ